MAKIKAENHIARIFLASFPAQRQWGQGAAAKHIRRLLDEGTEAGVLLQRIFAWARVRTDLRPWELAKEPPAPPIRKVEQARGPKPLPLGSVVIPEWLSRRTQAVLHPVPYELEEL